MARRDRDLELKIRTLIEGAEDVQELKEELRKLSQQRVPDTTKNFRGGLDRTRNLIAGVVGLLAGGALVRGIANVTRELEDVQRTARSLDESVETVQELNFVFRQFGLESKDVSDALNTVADRAQDAIDGAKGMQEDFGLLGISVDDLRGKKPGELFQLIAERVSQIEDPTRRNAAVVRLFGDDIGRKLLPMLLDGAEGMRNMRQEARDLGAVLGQDAVAAAARGSREFRKLREVFSAQFRRAVAENAGEFDELLGLLTDPDTLQGLTTFISGAITGFGKLIEVLTNAASAAQGFGENIAEAIHGPAGRSIQELEERVQSLDKEIEEAERDAERDPVFGGRRPGERSLAELRRQRAEAQAELDRQRDMFADIVPGGGSGDGDDSPAGGGFDPGQIKPDAQDAAKQRADSIAQIIDRLKEEAATTGEAAKATEIYKLEQLGASESTIELARQLLAEVEALEASEKAAQENAKAKREARQSNEQVLTTLREEIELLQIELEQGGRARFIEETVRQLERVEGVEMPTEKVRELAGELFDLREQAEDSAEGMSQFFVQAARNIESALADFLFRPFEQGLEGMFEGFADTLQRMVAEAASAQITEALFGKNFGESGEMGGLLEQGFNALASYFGGTSASVQHAGGMAGTGPKRSVPALAFAGAPRYHRGGIAGLRSNEIPSILRRGEEVLTPQDPRHRDNVGDVQLNASFRIITRDPDTRVERESRATRARERQRAQAKDGRYM